MNPILKVTSVDYIHNYVLTLSFNDRVSKLIEFRPLEEEGN